MKKTLELTDGWTIRGIEPSPATAHAAPAADGGPNLPAAGDSSSSGVPVYRGQRLTARMPRQVHELLLEAGYIADPAGHGGAEACRWVAEWDWVYERTFAYVPEAAGERAYLHFKGLDTLADIYLNGELLARHDNMYLPLRVEVTGKLQPENELVIRFRSVHEYLKNVTLPPEWEGKIKAYRLLRKSEHDFSMYLGPKPYLTRVGVYDKVLLETADGPEIGEIDLRVALSEDGSRGTVALKLSGAGFTANAAAVVEVRDPEGRLAASHAGSLEEKADGDWRFACELAVDRPRLWWPRGYGDQPLYEVSAAIYAGEAPADRQTRRIGFRRVVMEKPFDFVINGKRVKLWGAMSAQLQGITHCWDHEKAKRLFDRLENANMNAQRVWGGCDRYDDAFYDEADRRGILIWQEFFHDYGMFPDTEAYREQCRREAAFQVMRLKHHPSILFWCGGNECFMGAEYDHPGEPYIGGEIFLEDYKTICETLDPDRYYHINSPWGGRFCNDPLTGDTHSYTNTWYVPGADYPVLIAEEIRTSPPSVKSFLRFMGEERAWPKDYSGLTTSRDRYPWPETWTERTTTFGWLKIPPIEQFYDADSLEAAVYRFGAAHGLYLRRIIENNRRGKPSTSPEGERICKGHFVCRWNDSWPVIYGSMLDYYDEPYIPYYSVKRAYAPVLISFDVSDFIYLWVVNDSPNEVEGLLTARLFDPDTNRFVLGEVAVQVRVPAGESLLATDLNAFGQFSRRYVLFAQLTGRNGEVLARTNDFVDIERHLRFPEAKLSLAVEGDTLVVTCDKFARCVELVGNEDGDEFGWLFEDNYFDLLPGEVKRVRIFGRHAGGTISAKAYYSPHVAQIAYGRRGGKE